MKNKNKQTKFPVARIKRIMQKDEEVGKVAQATPIVISKALELFLGLIIEESSKVTIERGSKKVEAYHLKHAVETTEMLDFLKEIVEAVPDPSNGGTIDLEGENTEKKKRGKGKRTAGNGNGEVTTRKRRKKKGETDGEAGEAEAEAETKSDPDAEDAEDTNMEDADEDQYRAKSGGADADSDWEDKPFLPKR
ncbi:CBFD-NFYB-HMF domain-containing protein [Mycena sanguinolenta]|uniref:CBFD-NFYB-HMF domain-containing protein n=1 Tax=Mycena sanguinolenta TaxID=230812 RepID=A0A8H6YLM3_9AGAR|nr:CBFD-NFYB-HMF domain-containing protein [Mycena sanguinolenta]